MWFLGGCPAERAFSAERAASNERLSGRKTHRSPCVRAALRVRTGAPKNVFEVRESTGNRLGINLTKFFSKKYLPMEVSRAADSDNPDDCSLGRLWRLVAGQHIYGWSASLA